MKKLVFGILICFALALLWLKFFPASTEQTSLRSDEAPTEVSNETKSEQRSLASQSPYALAITAPALAARATVENLADEQRLAQFQADSKMPWIARRGGARGAIRTLARGAWLPISNQSAKEAAESFVKTYARDLFGVPLDQLQFAQESITDRTRVTYRQVVDGTEVYGAALSLFFENDQLTRVQNDLVALQTVSPNAPRDLAAAVELYRASMPTAAVALKTTSLPKTVLYPASDALVYAYEFSVNETVTESTPVTKGYRILYDAEDHHVIKKTPVEIQ